MAYDSEQHHRRSIRLKGYDYSQAGVYFVTICTQERQCLFGEINDDQVHLNEAGQMIGRVWAELAVRFPFVTLDESVIMP
jgi:putative transposase